MKGEIRTHEGQNLQDSCKYVPWCVQKSAIVCISRTGARENVPCECGRYGREGEVASTWKRSREGEVASSRCREGEGEAASTRGRAAWRVGRLRVRWCLGSRGRAGGCGSDAGVCLVGYRARRMLELRCACGCSGSSWHAMATFASHVRRLRGRVERCGADAGCIYGGLKGNSWHRTKSWSRAPMANWAG